MGLVLYVAWKLMNLCIIVIVAAIIPGSSGSIIQPPIVSPSVKSPPVHQTIQGWPFLSPVQSTTLSPQHDIAKSTPIQTPRGSSPPLSAESPEYSVSPVTKAPHDSTPPHVAELSHDPITSSAAPEPPHYSTPTPDPQPSYNYFVRPSIEAPHVSAVPSAAEPPEAIAQLPTAEPPEALPLASPSPPPEGLPKITAEAPVISTPEVVPVPSDGSPPSPVSVPPHSSALPLAAKPPDFNPSLPVAEPPQGLILIPPTEAPVISTPKAVPVPSHASPPSPVSVPPQSSALPLAAKPPDLNPSLPVAEPPQGLTLIPPTEAPPVLPVLPPALPPQPSDMHSPPVPLYSSSPPPQFGMPNASSPMPQLAPPYLPPSPPQPIPLPPDAVAPPSQLVLPHAPPPTSIVTSNASTLPPLMAPPSLKPPTTLPSLSPPLPPNALSPPPEILPPIISSPPQLNPPPIVSSPPPQLIPPSPPPQLNPPIVSSPPPQLIPPSPPPQLNPPIVSSPPQLIPPTVSSPPSESILPIVSSPPPDLIPPIVASPPQLVPPIVSSPPPQLIPPIVSSPPPTLIPPPASPPNSVVASHASAPPPLMVPQPHLTSPPPVTPHASAILPPPMPSHSSSPLPQLVPPHGQSPPYVFPAPPPLESPHSSPFSTPPAAPDSPVVPSHPISAPPPSEPSQSSVPPSPVMQRTVPSAPPHSSHKNETQEGAPLPPLISPEPSPSSRTLPEGAPPAHQVTSRSHPPSPHDTEAPKHAPFPRSNASEPDTSPSSAPPPSNNPISGRYSSMAPPGGAPDQPPRDKLSPHNAPSEPKYERDNATAPAPFSFRMYPARNGSHHSLRHSPNEGSPTALAPLPSPPSTTEISPAPSHLLRDPHDHLETPFLSPKISPSGSSTRNTKKPSAPAIQSLPPPPPNADCGYLTCPEPFTNTPPGSPCGCVWPMQVGLRLSVALLTFFPLVSELAREVAAGLFMKKSQVRVMGANAATQQSDKTIVLVDLVPLDEKFDNITAFLTFQRFWHKQVAIDKSIFGDYDVLYVRYPGLPPSPPMAPADVAVINGMPYSVQDPNGSKLHPLGVDVAKQSRKHRLNGIVVAAIVFSAVVGVLICCSVAWVLVFRHKNHGSQPAQTPRALPALARSSGPTGNSIGSGPSSSLSIGSSLATYTGAAKTFSASEIETATNNLSPSRIIGEGGFGLVYSGVLEDETSVAVKVLKRDDQQGGREFLAEVEMLSRLHHRNLVKLIGICTDERLRCLVYELIPNGSVDSHLHGTDKEIAPLDWASRMKIALGAARGLAYLHEDSSPRVIHRDFKSSNILLENDFAPKVSDFGLARSAMDEENRHISTRVMGTFGYVAPEYAMTGHLLVKSDVYSYGVVLLELLTGRKPVDMSQPAGQENLVAWTRPFLTTKEGLELILDPSLGSDAPLDSVAKVAAIASMCVQPEVSHRPFMGEVVQALKLVCNECDDSKDGSSRHDSHENLSVDFDTKASPISEAQDHLPSQYCLPNYHPAIDIEKGMSVSENFSATARTERQTSDSYRKHSASGPLKTARSRHFWLMKPSDGRASEHGIMYRLWGGSH